MIECPECWHQFHDGNKCPACGHVIPRAPIQRDETSATRSADEWLIRQGIISEGMTYEERKKAIHEYRQTVLARKPVADKSWARSILASGSSSYFSHKLATEALGDGNEDL